MNGANWTVQTGSFAIQSNQLVTTTNGSLMTFNGQTSNSATVDVFHVPPTSYDAIVLGFQDLNNTAASISAITAAITRPGAPPISSFYPAASCRLE